MLTYLVRLVSDKLLLEPGGAQSAPLPIPDRLLSAGSVVQSAVAAPARLVRVPVVGEHDVHVYTAARELCTGQI